MRKNGLKKLAGEGRVAVNAWLSFGSGYLAEVVGHAGYDAVTVDLQHGAFGFDTAVHLLQALSSTPAVPLARCAGLSLPEINKLLDAGAYGVICPLIESVDQAAVLARACRYPPRGDRSYGPARGLTYGGSDYPLHADDELMSLAMIETLPGLERLDAILAVDELDGIYLGPSDLGLAMGLSPGDWQHPRMAEAIAHVLKTTRAHGKYAGVFAATHEMAEAMTRQGFDLVTPGNDAQLMREAAALRIGRVRSAPKAK